MLWEISLYWCNPNWSAPGKQTAGGPEISSPEIFRTYITCCDIRSLVVSGYLGFHYFGTGMRRDDFYSTGTVYWWRLQLKRCWIFHWCKPLELILSRNVVLSRFFSWLFTWLVIGTARWGLGEMGWFQQKWDKYLPESTCLDVNEESTGRLLKKTNQILLGNAFLLTHLTPVSGWWYLLMFFWVCLIYSNYRIIFLMTDCIRPLQIKYD